MFSIDYVPTFILFRFYENFSLLLINNSIFFSNYVEKNIAEIQVCFFLFSLLIFYFGLLYIYLQKYKWVKLPFRTNEARKLFFYFLYTIVVFKFLIYYFQRLFSAECEECGNLLYFNFNFSGHERMAFNYCYYYYFF